MLMWRSCGSKHTVMFIRFLFIGRSASFLYNTDRSRELYNVSPEKHQTPQGNCTQIRRNRRLITSYEQGILSRNKILDKWSIFHGNKLAYE